MGCISSRASSHSEDDSHHQGVNRHVLIDWKVSWKSDEPMTSQILIQKRNEFWETAPAFEGQKEIWQALRAACEAEDMTMAQAILDSAGVSVPGGTLQEAYDERGTKYTIPVFCISDPKNLVLTEASAHAGKHTQEVSEGKEIPVKLRLASGKDVKIQANENESIKSLKLKLHDIEGVPVEVQKFFLMGKLLQNDMTLKQLGFQNGGLLQVLF